MRLKNVKKIVSFIIAVSMIMTLVPSVFAASVSDFTDFPTGWSREAVTAAVENGLLYGKSDTIIAPEDDLTRAEMAAIINRSFGATVEANITSYTDVPANAWYYSEIAKAVNMQTLEGDSASIMRPEDSITREEVFTVIARALVLETDDYSSLDRFTDGDDVSDWAKKYIACLAAKGYVNGDHEANLNSHENISREEFAQVMHNIIKTYYVEKGDYTTTGLASDLIRTGDINLSDITIDGDLIIGDGVGYGSVTLTNVVIKGRLLCRGGEKAIKLVNTTVEDKVVVKDVNGIVHFENYRDEAVFDDINMITNATFLTRKPGVPSVGGSSKPAHKHNWSTEWTTDDTHHWHECLKAGCTITDNSKKDGYGEHTWEHKHDGEKEWEECSVCGAKRNEGVHVWETKYDENKHWEECTCGAKKNEVDHTWVPGHDADKHWEECFCGAKRNEEDHTWEHKHDDEKEWEECNVCGARKNEGDHTWGTKYDENKHWEECTCGAKRNEVDHTWVPGHDADKHWEECSCGAIRNEEDHTWEHKHDDEKEWEECNVCGARKNEGDHTWGTKYDENKHWEECTCGAKRNEVDHTWVPSHDAGKHWEECSCGAKRNEEDHTWVPNHDENKHWEECSCGAKRNEADHTWETKYNENKHWEECSCGEKKNEVDHTWVTNHDDDKHWEECICGAKRNEEDHTWDHKHDDEKEWDECIVCGAKKNEGDHTWETKYNENKHWEECSCGAKRNEVDHTWVLNHDDDKHWEECICGAKRNEEDHIWEHKNDGVKEWDECIVCGAKKNEGEYTEKYIVEFYNGMMKDVDPIATQNVDKDSTLKGIEVTIDDIYTNNGVTITGNEITYPWDGKGIYEGKYTHSVAPEYIYFNEKDGANQWEVFTEETVLDEATVGSDKVLEVYYAYKNIAVLLSNIVPIDALNTISINADYNSQSRVVDTTKVLMINTRDQLEIGKAAIEDKQKEAFTLIGNKTNGMITPEGIINYFPADLKIVDVIPYSDVEESVLSYIEDILKNGTADEIKEVSPYMAEAELDAYVSRVMDARQKNMNGDSSELKQIVTDALSSTKNFEPYKKIMKDFEAKKDVFKLNDDNKVYAKAIAYEVGSFTYEEIKPYLEAKGYGAIIKLIGKDENGKDLFASMFLESRTNYSQGLLELVDKVNADSSYTTTYSTSLSVEVDVVSVLKNMYSKVTEEAKELFAGKEIYLYEENDALQRFANINWFNVFVKETGDGRYQVADFFTMYDAMLDTLILVDDAITWYGDPANYPSSDYDAVKKELGDDMIAYIDGVINIVDQITTGQPIGGKYTIKQLIDKVQDLNKIADALGNSSVAAYADTMKSLVDTMTNILTNLGEGDLPGGYTLDTVNKLCGKLQTAIGNITDENYETVNKEANDLIKKALKKLDAMFDELDENGTIRGKSIEALVKKFAIFEKLYDQYGAQIKKIISLIADANMDEAKVDIDSEWIVDIFFGADEDNRFTMDNLIEIAPDKFKTEVNAFTDTADETYIVDYYQVKSDDASVKAQRTIR